MHDPQVNQIIGHLFRHEAGKMAAVLTRLLGFQSIDLAEDIVQDTLLTAMSVWRIKGVPENPPAWLYKVAKRKAIDTLRQRQVHEHHHEEIANALRSEWTLTPTVNTFFLEHEIEDSQLRMMFACCHPSIPYESQIALMLKTLCGLSIHEIASSFLTGEETITKRLYRARDKIREEQINLESPLPAVIPGRIDAVLHALYLLFNEGYNSSHPDQLIRHDLCEEAMRLTLLLTRNRITDSGKSRALLALMCFQASREAARIDPDGSIRLLKDQDRTRWSVDLITKGKQLLDNAISNGDYTEYHIEAAIAGCHSIAAHFDDTDWKQVAGLYEILLTMKPGPIVELNRAIAIGYAVSPQQGLETLNEITTLDAHYLFHAARGDFHCQLEDHVAACTSFKLAIELTSSSMERQLLHGKIASLSAT